MANFWNGVVKLWNRVVDAVGNFFGFTDTSKRNLMGGDKVTDTQITDMVNRIKSAINKKKNLSNAELARINNALEDLASLTSQIGSPSLNKYVQDARNTIKDDLRRKQNQLERNLDSYEEKLTQVDERADDARNLAVSDKMKDATEIQHLQEMVKQEESDLNNYERRISDEI